MPGDHSLIVRIIASKHGDAERYVLTHPGGATETVNSAEWLTDDLKTFRVVIEIQPHGWETIKRENWYEARREQRKGKPYWYAYRRYQQKLFKVYIGAQNEIDGKRLIAAHEKLIEKMETARDTGAVTGWEDFFRVSKRELVASAHTEENEPLYRAAVIAGYLGIAIPHLLGVVKTLKIAPVEMSRQSKRRIEKERSGYRTIKGPGLVRITRYYTADHVEAIVAEMKRRRLKAYRKTRFNDKASRDKAEKQARKSQK
jgi:hypothetical protein